MISLSPETISYISVSSAYSDGEMTESQTIVSGIKCSVQQATENQKVNVNGTAIVYTHSILVTNSIEKAKVPAFNISDKVTFDGITFKVLSQRKRQHHIEIYV